MASDKNWIPEPTSARALYDFGGPLMQQDPDYREAYADGWNAHYKATLEAAPQPDTVEPVADGYALIPKTIALSYDDIENIVTMTAWDEGREGFGEGLLWVGSLQDDDGNKTHGLNISCVEVMEEGGLSLHEFNRPRPPEKPDTGAVDEALAHMRVADDKLFAGLQSAFPEEARAFLVHEARAALRKARALLDQEK